MFEVWQIKTQAIREIERNNLQGTGAVMRATLQQRVERVVYTSSVATLRVNSETTAATEDAPLASNEATSAYTRSKVLAERLVVEMVARDSLPAIIVNPSTQIGAHDVRPTPTGRVIQIGFSRIGELRPFHDLPRVQRRNFAI